MGRHSRQGGPVANVGHLPGRFPNPATDFGLLLGHRGGHLTGQTTSGDDHGRLDQVKFFDPAGNRNEVFAGLGYRAQHDFPTITWTADQLARGIYYHARELSERFHHGLHVIDPMLA